MLSSHLVYGFLCCAKVLSLIKSHLFIFGFISVTLGGGSKKILLWFMSKSVFPIDSYTLALFTQLALLLLIPGTVIPYALHSLEHTVGVF